MQFMNNGAEMTEKVKNREVWLQIKMEENMSILANYLAQLIKAQLNGEKPVSVPEEIQVEDLIHLSCKNHMEYLVMGALLKTDGISEEIQGILRSHVMRSIVRTTTQIMDLKEIIRRFEEKKIVNQPMKGAQMKFIYPSPEMREMSDIDILIRHDCMDRAAEELKDMGYVLEQAIEHHDIYVKEPFMVVEAHRAMYDKTVDNNQYEYFSNFSKAILKKGYKYTYDFNDEDFYIYMIAHMAKHFYVKGCGVRNLVDIYVYLKAKEDVLNHKYVEEELKKLGLSTFTKHMEKLAFAWLDQKPFTEFQQQVFDYMLDSGIYGKDENGIWNKFSEFKMKGKEVSKFRLKLWYFFPPIVYMAEYYPWIEGKPFLLPIAWGIRACRGIFMRKGTDKRKMIHEIEQEQVQVYKNIYQEMQLHFK